MDKRDEVSGIRTKLKREAFERGEHWVAVPCSCGHEFCNVWHVSPYIDTIGVSLTKEQAEVVAKALNEHEKGNKGIEEDKENG